VSSEHIDIAILILLFVWFVMDRCDIYFDFGQDKWGR
jgi:hypothetical protein